MLLIPLTAIALVSPCVIETLNIPVSQVPPVHVLSHPPGLPVRAEHTLSPPTGPAPVHLDDHVHGLSNLAYPVSYLPLRHLVRQPPQLHSVGPVPITPPVPVSASKTKS